MRDPAPATQPAGYSIVPSREWEQILLDNDRLKRTVDINKTNIERVLETLEMLRLDNDRLKRALRTACPGAEI